MARLSDLGARKLAAIALCGSLAAACGGGGGGGRSSQAPPMTSAPGAPLDLTANVGDRAVSLGWHAPASNGGALVQAYEIASSPALAPSDVQMSGTRALIRNLSNGVSYTFSIRARNSAGLGPPANTPALTPAPIDASAYGPIMIQGDSSPSGVFDPSVLPRSNGELWLSYSSVSYYNNAQNHLVQDVGIRLARSTNGGASFLYEQTIAAPSAAVVTDTDPAHSACGAAICNGRWVYETSWLIEDVADPDPARRVKLFAHKYFLRPGAATPTLYHLGAIVMWTAPSPDGTWSEETSLLGWPLTPPELAPMSSIDAMHADLANCIAVAEGTSVVREGAIEFAFACPYVSASENPQKIVMLRSTDHAQSFQYVATLLDAPDAAALGADFFTAPSFAASDTAPALLVTPTFEGIYAGCIAIPFADLQSGALFRIDDLPVGILYAPPVPDRFGGACAYDPRLGSQGILLSGAMPSDTPAATRFDIYATQADLQAE